MGKDITVNLRKFNPSSADHVASWITSREEQFLWAAHSLPFPVQGQDIKKALAEFTGLHQAFGMYETGSEKLVGYLELSDVDVTNLSAMVSRVLVSPDYRGRGVARSALRELEAYVTTWNTHRLSLIVSATNASAIQSYLNAGFIQEGSLRDARFFDGEFRTINVMSKILT